MNKWDVLEIFTDAIEHSSPVMVHFGYDPENVVVLSGPKEPMIKVEIYHSDMIHAVTKSNMQFYLNPADIKLIQIADITDPRFTKEPPPRGGMYN
jgi:hypothetical protein